MTDAEPQARYHATPMCGTPLIRTGPPVDRGSRTQRWNDTTVAKPRQNTITRIMADRQSPVDA
ncbi:MAG TPA: hypothetical protein VGM32_18320 [Rhodopila sp.]|jgi:hypothetical protein